MLVSVLTYTAASELIEAIGKARVRLLFFGIGPRPELTVED